MARLALGYALARPPGYSKARSKRSNDKSPMSEVWEE